MDQSHKTRKRGRIRLKRRDKGGLEKGTPPTKKEKGKIPDAYENQRIDRTAGGGKTLVGHIGEHP